MGRGNSSEAILPIHRDPPLGQAAGPFCSVGDVGLSLELALQPLCHSCTPRARRLPSWVNLHPPMLGAAGEV